MNKKGYAVLFFLGVGFLFLGYSLFWQKLILTVAFLSLVVFWFILFIKPPEIFKK